MSKWKVDPCTVMQFDMGYETSPTASLFDSSTNDFVAEGVANPAATNGIVLVSGPDGGSARQFLASSGSNYQGVFPRAGLYPQIRTIATLDALVLKTGSIDSQIPIVSLRDPNFEPDFAIYISPAGSPVVSITAGAFNQSNFVTTNITGSVIFPTASWYALRATYDAGEGKVSLWGCPWDRPFYDLLVTGTTAPGYNINTAHTMKEFDVHYSSFYKGGIDGIAHARLSSCHRSDSIANSRFTSPTGSNVLSHNQGVSGQKRFPFRKVGSALITDKAMINTGSAATLVGPSVVSVSDNYASGTINWSNSIIDSIIARTISNYSISTITGGTITPGSIGAITAGAEVLNLSGDYRTGGTYSLLIEPGTVRDSASGAGNAAVTASFSLAGIIFTGSSITASPQSQTSLNVTFVKPVTQVNPANSNDALNPANYTIVLSGTQTQLAVLNSTSVSSDTVNLTLSTNMSPVQYIITVYNVTDLLGNKI